jgi:hypothetical protein
MIRVEQAIELFEERAAIYEYDAGLPRDKAEDLARLEICEMYGSWLRVAIEDHLRRKVGGSLPKTKTAKP